MTEKFIRHARRSLLTLLAVALAPAPAAASEAQAAAAVDPLDVEFNLALVSDYRYRGISLSDGKPSLQADVTFSHASGAYAGLWASTIAANEGADLETQITLGYAMDVAGLSLDLQTLYYFYPGAMGDNYGELAARASRAAGVAEMGITLSYTPPQENLDGLDNLYVGIDGAFDWPNGPVQLNAAIGLEDGAFGDRKLDWSIGASGEIDTLTLGLAYIDSHRSPAGERGGATLVASVSQRF